MSKLTVARGVKFTLRRVRLNKQGYDNQGCYWGVDLPLYWYMSDDKIKNHYPSDHIRATDRNDAKQQIVKLYPFATFYN